MYIYVYVYIELILIVFSSSGAPPAQNPETRDEPSDPEKQLVQFNNTAYAASQCY